MQIIRVKIMPSETRKNRAYSRAPLFFPIQTPDETETEKEQTTKTLAKQPKSFLFTDARVLSSLLLPNAFENVIACANRLLADYDRKTKKQVATLHAALFTSLNSSGETLYACLVRFVKSLPNSQQKQWKKGLYALLLRAISTMTSDQHLDPYLQVCGEKTPTLENISTSLGMPYLSAEQLQQCIHINHLSALQTHVDEKGNISLPVLIKALTENRFSFEGMPEEEMEMMFGELNEKFRIHFLTDTTSQDECQVISEINLQHRPRAASAA